MSDEALAAAVPGRPKYTVKEYIQLVEALRFKAAALTSISGQPSSHSSDICLAQDHIASWFGNMPGSNSCMQLKSNVSAAIGQFCWFSLTSARSSPVSVQSHWIQGNVGQRKVCR